VNEHRLKVYENSSEENIWTREGGSSRKMDEIAK
jgi:hypothetical protein